MKKCMYTYNYHRKRAIIHQDHTSNRILFGILGIAALYGAFCLRTLVRS